MAGQRQRARLRSTSDGSGIRPFPSPNEVRHRSWGLRDAGTARFVFEQPSSSCFGLEVCSLVSSPRVLLVAVLLEAQSTVAAVVLSNVCRCSGSRSCLCSLSLAWVEEGSDSRGV